MSDDRLSLPPLKSILELRSLPEGVDGCCVYFLWRDADLLYVGASNVTAWRVRTHTWAAVISFERATMLETEPIILRRLERSYIKAYKPRFNKLDNPDWLLNAEHKPGRPAALTPAQEFEMRQFREAGLTIRECEGYFNVSRATVFRVLAKQRKRLGLEKLPKGQYGRAYLTSRGT